MNIGKMKILLIEDNPGDVRLIQEALNDAPDGPMVLRHADRLSTGLHMLTMGGVDVVLLDLGLPDGNGLDTVHRVRAQAPHMPIVVLTMAYDMTTAVRAMQAGAQDYLFKDEFHGEALSRALRYALERHRLQEELRTLTLVDLLTGLYNRRGFIAIADYALKRAAHAGTPALLALLEFANVDKVVAEVGMTEARSLTANAAKALKETCTPVDVLAHISDFRFAVLVPDCETGAATEATIARWRTAIGATFSLRACARAFDPKRPLTAQDLLNAAEEECDGQSERTASPT